MEPLERFFARYDGFDYNPSEPATAEFERLCDTKGWPRPPTKSRKGKRAHSSFKDAIIRQFNTSYGTDINDLNGWHALMMHLDVNPLPDNVAQCKKIVKGMYVNLVDLVDARGEPEKKIDKFESEKALGEYTRGTRKFFPRDEAKAGGILKFLLRHILSPSNSRR